MKERGVPAMMDTFRGEMADLRLRLRRAAGQLNGIERMVADGRPHEEILTQLAAVQGTLRVAEQEVFSDFVRSMLAGVSETTMSVDEAAEVTAFLAGILVQAASPGRARHPRRR